MSPSGGVLLSFLLLLGNPGSQLAVAELITTTVGVGSALLISGFFAGHNYFKCKMYECCESAWIPANLTALKASMKERLYGQHLVQETVLRALKAHVENENPKKALVISFHGWTGCGKNYVSQMIAESLYHRGFHSEFVHFFVGGLHFPHAQHVDTYKEQLHSWIHGNVTKCGRSLFVFDELDKVPVGVLDAIKPFIDHHKEIHGVDYRRSVFIFLSNTGGSDITQRTLEYWQRGRPREDIRLPEMEQIITLAAYNEDSGLRFSDLIKHHLIDHFIPFLPLEREHVKLCVRDYFRVYKKLPDPTEEQKRKVADMLQYFPKGSQVYSASGCKRVAQKVELLLEEEEEESRRGDEL